MLGIGGNKQALLQEKATQKNAIGEHIETYTTTKTLLGFLDYMQGDTEYNVYNAKIQESTHVFVGDYVDLSSIKVENARMLIDNKLYDVILIDNPMELNKQIEIYLKYTGGQ